MNKKRAYEILEKASPGDRLSQVFDVFIIVLISLNIFVVIIDTVQSISASFSQFFRYFEWFSIAIFSVEYVLRVWSCTASQIFKNPVRGRLRYMLSPLALVDLLAILPFYLPMLIPCDLRMLRAVRLFRLFRILKMGRYSKAIQLLCQVIKRKREELVIMIFLVFVLLIIASSLMYYIEHAEQPDAFSSIPEAMWWGVATLTTVGYGDVYPVTSFGKAVGAFISLLGIGLFALPAGILASGFAESIQDGKKSKITCPHCGKEIDNP